MKIKNISKKLNEIFQKFIKEKCMYILKEQKIIIIFILLYCFVIFILGSFLTKDNFFSSVLILIPFLSFYTYLIRVNYFKKELKNIDKMNRFLIDEEYKNSLNLAKYYKEILFKVFILSISVVSAVIYNKLGEDSYHLINILKFLIENNVIKVILIFFIAFLFGIIAASSANDKRIEVLRKQYKNE